MGTFWKTSALALAVSLLGGCHITAGEDAPADEVVYARVITMEPSHPRASGLAIRDGVIVKVAPARVIKGMVGRSTRIFNWRRWTVVPGLIDAHVDLVALGESMVGLDLYDSTGMEDIAGRVRAVMPERGQGKEHWIVGYGWEEHRFRDFLPLDRELIDEVARWRPVLLYRADRHAALVNGKALELAGITKDTKDPPGGRIGRRKDGEPNGVLYGRAVDLVASKVPSHPHDVLKALVSAALGKLLHAGFTTVHDMGGTYQTWKVLVELAEDGKLPIRVYESIDSRDPNLGRVLEQGPKIELYDNYLTLRTIRIALDGDLGSHMAYLKSPYQDHPGERGLLTADMEHVVDVCERAYEHGFQVAFMARGSGGVALSLDALERLLPTWKHWAQVRPRLEGADVVDPDDTQRFGMTHLIASVQPARLSRQIYWLSDRLGDEDRLLWAHPWRSLERGGAIISFGTGAPEMPPDPRKGYITAVLRQDETGWPPGGWKPIQRLTAPEALRAFTLNAAYAGFEERIKGSIRPGKLADLTVLSRDILYTDPYDLDRIRVLGTIVGGRIRYRTRYLR